MTFTWDSTSVGTNLARIRGRLGDTDSGDALLTDEQINQALTDTGDDLLAATVKCCRAILGGMARKIDRNGSRFNATRSQLFQHYKDLLEELKTEAASLAGPSWTEHSEAATETIEDDDDFVQPSFRIGRDDNG